MGESPSERSGVVEIEGRKLAWRSLGAGPPLLLINGYAATAADWDPTFLTELARSFEVICPDNRGMAGSDLGDPQALTIEAMATDLVALLDDQGIGQTAVAGWSMGGFVAQTLTSIVPTRVSRLALLGTDPGGPNAALAEPATWARLTDHSGTPREQASRIIELLFPPTVAAVIDRDFGEIVAEARAELSAEALEAQERAMIAWHSQEQPPPNADWPPTMLACGDQDLVIPPQNSEQLSERYRASGPEVFPGAGHAFMAQEPARLAKLIKSSLLR